MNHTLKTNIAMGMFALVSGVVVAQSGNDLFQQALVKERTEGNPTEVIPLYEKIVQQHGADRKLAAKALYQIGQAYEKLGQVEARKAYERIAREFADQKEVAADAGRRLAMLNGGMAISGRPTSSLVWKDRKVDLTGSISADGRYLSFVDWTTGNLALHDVVTGQDRVIVTAKNVPKAKLQEFAEESAISPDGRQVVYTWYDGTKDHCELRIANLTGDPNPRQLYEGANVEWVEPRHWSPDGSQVAVLINLKDRTDQLALISPRDKSLRILRSGDWPSSTRVFFSPDGKYLGYDLPQDDAKERDVWLTATDGSGHSVLVAHRSNDVMMGWSPDGKQLLFRSDRTGSMALWSQTISGGKPLGAPEMIKPDMGAQTESLGVTGSGALFFGVRKGRPRLGTVQIGSFDFATGSVASSREVSDDYLEENTNPCWSPDGKHLAYLSTRDRMKTVIVIRSVGSDRVSRELPYKLRPTGLSRLGLAEWEPNGRGLLLAGENIDRKPGVFRVDVETGEISLLFASPPLVTLPVWSPDGRSVYYHRSVPGDTEHAYVQRDIASGVEKEVIRRPALGGIRLSPDGSYLASSSVDPLSNERILLLIPLRGGAVREMMRIPVDAPPTELKNFYRGTNVAPAFWSPDSRSFIARKGGGAGFESELWQVPVDGGSPRKLDVSLEARVFKFTLSPNGRSVAFRREERVVQADDNTREVWVLENFLSAGN